jgi:hypothetical protein
VESYKSQTEVALSVLGRANRTPVPPELLIEAMELFAGMSFEERSSFDIRTLRLIDFLTAKGFSGEPHADLVVAITFRYCALAQLVCCDLLKDWITAQDQGMTRLHADIIRAAAEEALVEEPDSAAAFEVSSFVRRILLVAQPQGRA